MAKQPVSFCFFHFLALLLLVNYIVDLARTVFNFFDAGEARGAAILLPQPDFYFAFHTVPVELTYLVASNNHRRRGTAVECSDRHEKNKGQYHHAHHVVLPAPTLVGPEEDFLESA